MFKIGIISGLLGIYPKEKIKLQEIKRQADEARNRDLERETKINQKDFILENDEAFNYLLEHYNEKWTIDENILFQQLFIKIGAYTLVFDKWFIEKEEMFFKLQKLNFLWKKKSISNIGYATKEVIELENEKLKKINKITLMENLEIKTLLKNQSVEVNKTIAIEELSELQKEICKDLRGVDRRENIKEEMTDVYICLQLLKEIYGFTDEELEEEYKRKMKRNLDRVKV